MSIKIKIGKSLNVAVSKKEVKVMESRQKVAAEIDFDIKIKKSKNGGEKDDKESDDHLVLVDKVYTQDHYSEWHKNKDKNLFEEIIDKMMVESFMDETFKPYIDEVREIIGKKLPKDKKRFAILCTLDKNRNLLRKAKVYNTTSITKMEHIKDYIKILRDYVKVSEVEKKKFGEVMTPIDLVKEMLNKLPREVWSNPDLKWLDPCNGVGPFGALVVAGLMKGLSEWEFDEEKRYKHIVENMVYVCELQPKNMFLWMCMMDPKDEYYMNVYCGSFLDAGFDKHMKEVWGIEKFDVVVGNPPYQMAASKTHKLWVYFLDKAHDMSDILLFVNPTLLCDGRSKNIKDIRNKILKNLSYINFANKGIFNIGEEVCYYLLDKSKKVNETRVTLLDKSEVFREYEDIIYEDDIQQVINSIIDKISSKQPKINWYSDIKNTDGNGAPKSLLKTGLFSESEDEIFKFKVHHSASNTLWCSEKKSSGSLKLIFNFSGGYYDINDPDRYMFISDGIVGKQMESILINSIGEGNKLKKIYSSKIFRFFIENEKTGGFNTGLFKIPLLSSEIEWTDEKLFEYFGLSEEEKNLILKIV